MPLSGSRWCFVVLVASSIALAQAPHPSVMPFPLEFKRTPPLTTEDREGLQRQFNRVLRLAGAAVPDFAHYDRARAELRRQDCEDEDICLVELARKADALYGLYAKLDVTLEGAVVATGRVVRRDGKVASPTQAVSLALGSEAFPDVAVKALSQLLAVLKLAELPTERSVDTPDQVVKLLPPAPPPQLERAPIRPVAVAAGLIAVGAGGGAIALAVTNLREATALSTAAHGGLIPATEVDRAVALDERTVAATALGIGACISAAVAIGALVWRDAPVQLAPSAPPGGAGLTLSGRLP